MHVWTDEAAALGITHRDSSAPAVGARHQTALGRCHGDLELLPVQVKRSSHTDRHGHVANDVLTTGAYHLSTQNTR